MCVYVYIGRCCPWLKKNLIERIPTDNDNRLIVSIKFGLLCVKPYLIMLTKSKTKETLYQVLQFCSLVTISYLTYSKIHYKSFQTNRKSLIPINSNKIKQRWT